MKQALTSSRPADAGTPSDASPPHARERHRSWVQRVGLDRFSAVYLAALFVVVFGSLHPDTFLTDVTFRLVFSEGVITATLALAFVVPLAAGVYDLSIGAVMSLSLFIVNWFGIHTGINAALVALGALAVGALVGAVSGFVVVKLRVNSFIATLGISQLVAGVVLLGSGTNQITGAFSDQYRSWGRGDWLGVPRLVYYLVALAIVLWAILEHTPAGRYLFATGGNPDAARLAGVATERSVWLSLVASGALAALAGVFYSVKVGTFSTTVGPGYLFPAVAAVFFGASQFNRRPNVWGTLVALYSLALGIKGLQLQFASGGYWIEPTFQGTALIFAVALASHQFRARRTASSAAASADVPPS